MLTRAINVAFGRKALTVVGSLAFCVTALLSRCPAQENPQQPSPPLPAAQSALEQGNAAGAIHILVNYLETYPEDSHARVTLGQAYAVAGQTDRAEVEFQTVIKRAPENYVALAALAEIYDHRGQPEKAEPLLGRAVKASHGIPRIRLEWAIVLARLHEYQKAQSALSGLWPPVDQEEQIRFYRLKGAVALGLGKTGSAATAMEKALLLKPDNQGLILATAAAQLQASNWQRAAELTKPIFTETHDPSVGMMLLEALLGANADVEPTLEALRTAAMNAPEESEIRQRLAQLLVSHRKFAESIEDFQRAVVLDPNRGDLHFNVALAQFRTGRLDDALASAGKSKELEDSADLEDLLGDIQEARGDNLGAVKSFQAAVVLAPNEEKHRVALALELLRHKSFEATKVVLQQADESHPNSWRIQFALGMLEYFMGKEDEATPILQRAAELSPDPTIALKYAGDIQLDRAAGPDPALISQLCMYADLHPKEAMMQYYCGALLFRRDYVAENKTNLTEILRRLNTAARRLPNDPAAHCQLGRAYRWIEQWQSALQESEVCVRLDSDSAQPHYRLAQIYHHQGQAKRAQEEMSLFEAASKRMADENTLRDETMKTFLITIQKETPDHN